MKAIDDLKDFWGRQTRNFKVIMARDAITHLFAQEAGGGGPGGGEMLGGGQYWNIFLSRLGATSTEIGLLRSIANAINTLLAVPFGWLIDRTQRKKRTYIVGKVLSLPVALMRYLARTWPFCILVVVWETISMRIMSPPSQIILIDSLSNRDRVTGLSINRMVMSIAGLFGPMTCALIISYFGGLGSADNIRPLFLVQFAVGLATMVLVVTQMQEVAFPVVGQKTGIISHLVSVFKEIPLLKLLLLRQVAMMFVNDIGMAFMSIYMVDVKGANEFILGWRGTAHTAVIVALSMPIGLLADKFGRLKSSYLGRVFGFAGILLMIFTPLTHPEYLIISGLLEGFRMLMFIGWIAFEQELVPIEARGRYGGITMAINGAAGVVAPILGGLIWNINPDYIWWIRLFGDAFIVLPLMMIVGYKASKLGR